MTLFFFFLGLFQCVVLYILGKTGLRLQWRARRQWDQVRYAPPHGWPVCAVIVPVSGGNPFMEPALRSLAEQNYPAFTLYLVTAATDDPACALIDSLRRQYACIEHVVAGHTSGRGQKNHNLLAGVRAAGEDVDAYVFCDSTHIAREDFLRCLVYPLAKSEAAFTTGYHEVEPRDQRIVTLAYALSVLFMHFMQGLPGLTQPWGGAMAMNRHAFEHYRIANLWAANVVDDCSLAALLAREGAHVSLCPGAILRTFAAAHSLPVWRAWLGRQILFLKFCMPGEWLSLGFVCLMLAVPPLWFAYACLMGLFGLGGDMAPFLALCWFCVLGWIVGSWRHFLPRLPAISYWLWAFFCATYMFLWVYLATLGSRILIWNNIAYKVGKGGNVEKVTRR